MPENFSPEFVAGFRQAQVLAEAIVQRARQSGETDARGIIWGIRNLEPGVPVKPFDEDED